MTNHAPALAPTRNTFHAGTWAQFGSCSHTYDDDDRAAVLITDARMPGHARDLVSNGGADPMASPGLAGKDRRGSGRGSARTQAARTHLR